MPLASHTKIIDVFVMPYYATLFCYHIMLDFSAATLFATPCFTRRFLLFHYYAVTIFHAFRLITLLRRLSLIFAAVFRLLKIISMPATPLRFDADAC